MGGGFLDTVMNDVMQEADPADSSGEEAAVSLALPHLDRVNSICAEIRQLSKELRQSNASTKSAKILECTMLLTQLKRASRETYLSGEDFKQRVTEQKSAMERDHLQLENLLYEKNHLIQEIKRCQGFSMKEMQKIELEAGEVEISINPELHKDNLNRLANELQRRKSMQKEIQEIRAKVKAMEATAASKNKFLEGLPRHLLNIEEATRPVQSYMSIALSETKALHNEAMQLARPLYVIFCELEAYISAHDCQTMKLCVAEAKKHKKHAGKFHVNSLTRFKPSKRGNLQLDDPDSLSGKRSRSLPSRSPSPTAASSVNPSPVPSPVASPCPSKQNTSSTPDALFLKNILTSPDRNGEDGELDEADNQDDTKSVSNSVDGLEEEEHQVDLLETSPKAVVFQLPTKYGEHEGILSIRFQYLPHLDIVTAETPGFPHLLTSLFPGDIGRSSTNLANAYTYYSENKDGKKIPFEYPTDLSPRPYYWLQWIAGTSRLIRDTEHRPEPSIQAVVQRIKDRLASYQCLKEQLELLNKGKGLSCLPVHPDAKSMFSEETTTTVESWKDMKQPGPDLFDSISDSRGRFGYKYYKVIFKSKRARLGAIVEVSPEYPIRPPQFLFQSRKNAIDQHTAGPEPTPYDNQLKDIEIEVNAYYNELTPGDSANYLLSHQIRKVQMCFDILNSSETFTASFGRFRRGKDRRRAIVVSVESNECHHR